MNPLMGVVPPQSSRSGAVQAASYKPAPCRIVPLWLQRLEATSVTTGRGTMVIRASPRAATASTAVIGRGAFLYTPACLCCLVS